MKHEAFARAMSQLDDELILQAHQDAAARQGALLWRRIRRIAAAAACLLLVLGAAWLFLPARVELTLPQPGQSVLSSEPGIAVQDMRGAQSESDAVAMPQSAVALLEKVWASYGENEKFEAVGGDMSEANMKEDAPGVFSTEDTDALDQTLGYPASAVSYIDGAASLVHMLNANTFTCGAFHLKSVDNSAAAAKAVRENLAQRHWMCGFPEKLVQIQCGEYLVCFFGDGELCDTFRAKLEAAYPDAAFLSETPIE